MQCGQFIEDAEGLHKGQLLGWLRDNVPNLTPKQAKAYLSLFHTEKKRESHRLEAQQMRLLGIISETSERKGPEPQQRDQRQWAGLITRAVTILNKTVTEQRVEEWPEDQRTALCTHLEPLVELYNRAKI